MKLHILGTGNGGALNCYNTCFAIENNKEYFLVDGGGGNQILNQLKLAKLTNVIATNNEALNSAFYNDYRTLQSQARSTSAKQLQKVSPVMKQHKNQKELNNLVNTAVQKILTSKNNNTQEILDKLSQDWAKLVEN